MNFGEFKARAQCFKSEVGDETDSEVIAMTYARNFDGGMWMPNRLIQWLKQVDHTSEGAGQLLYEAYLDHLPLRWWLVEQMKWSYGRFSAWLKRWLCDDVPDAAPHTRGESR